MEIGPRLGLTVEPAPEFLVLDREMTRPASAGFQSANGGATALDKAARSAARPVDANGQGTCPCLGSPHALADGEPPMRWAR